MLNDIALQFRAALREECAFELIPHLELLRRSLCAYSHAQRCHLCRCWREVTTLSLEVAARRMHSVVNQWSVLGIAMNEVVVPATDETADLIGAVIRAPLEPTNRDLAQFRVWRAQLQSNAEAVARQIGMDVSTHLSMGVGAP